MAIDYAWEKFFSAVYGSIGSERSPQDRLADSYVFDIIHVRREDVPNDEVWERIQKLTRAVTSKPAEQHEGSVKATTSEMSSAEAARWLQEIVSIFNEIAEAYGAAYSGTPVNGVRRGVRRAVQEYSEVIRKLSNE
jgi:hypothetical protein